MRKPWQKWIIISRYIGNRKKYSDLSFYTQFIFFRRESAQKKANRLNAKAFSLVGQHGPGKDFVFEVVPYASFADSPEGKAYFWG